MQYKIEIEHHKGLWWKYIFSAPPIYALIVPLVLLDIFVEFYHRTSFPLYDLPYVKRSQYVLVDRQKLSYLSWFEKINCVYCGYANGLLQYVSTILGETEKYWCGVLHARYDQQPPSHHKNFLPYSPIVMRDL